MSDLSRTKMESHKLLEGIDKLRNIEPAFRSAFVEDRDDDSTGGSNIAGVSSYLAECEIDIVFFGIRWLGAKRCGYVLRVR